MEPWEIREDGTPKGKGWLGVMKMRDGTNRDMTEYSIGVNIGGKETLIPSVVPTLSPEEVNHLLSGGKVTDSIMGKAIDHAKVRLMMGLNPFKD